MLKRSYRLKKNRDFKEVFQQGKSILNKYMVLYYRKNHLQKLRIGFTVSKKIGGAVVRNRIKRILREAVRKHILEMVSGIDIILIARGTIKGIKSIEVEQYLVKLLEKNRLLKNR